MLDLEAVLDAMNAKAQEVLESARTRERLRELVSSRLTEAAGLPWLRDAVHDFLASAKQEMALPLAAEPMTAVFPPPAAGDYTVMATDGSQIEPNYHHIAEWYVLNSGAVVLRYGPPEGRARSLIQARPVLKPPRRLRTEQEAANDQDGHAAAVGPPPGIAVERLKAELDAAAQLLAQEGDPGRTVLLLDGPLIQWRMLKDLREGDRREIIGLFQALVRSSREMCIPIAGYVSRPRAVAWITLLRFALCPDVRDPEKKRLCDDCRQTLLRDYDDPKPTAHHAELAGLRDADLVARLLPASEEGWRTQVVELHSKMWNDVSDGAGGVGFFYLQAGTEVARVELPEWVWTDAEQMRLLHSAIWDQCVAGRGYPMVLSEAHEAAVVRGPERNAFYLLIERLLSTYDLPEATLSAKATSKRRPLA